MIIKNIVSKTAKLLHTASKYFPRVYVHLLSWTIFAAGACLVITGNIPVERIRINWVRENIPLELFELSHFLNSIIGVVFLFLANAIRRRVDAAYYTISVLLFVSCAFSLLKGFNWELSVFLILVLISLLPTKKLFYKKASLLMGHMSTTWFFSMLGVLFGAFLIGLWNYRYVQYSDELWWKFAFNEGAGRFLRVNIGFVILAFFFSLTRLFRSIQYRAVPDNAQVVQQAFDIVNVSENIDSFRALFGDKKFLFSKNKQAFLMYSTRPKSFVILGDPVGSKEEWPELIMGIKILADRYDAHPIFSEIKKDHLHFYLDAGFDVVKLGEEARIQLSKFSLEGGDMAELRRAQNKCEKEGCEFEIIPPHEVARYMNELREISNEWLKHKNASEKSFSLGFFDEEYLKHCSIAIVKVEGKIVAFSNIWMNAVKKEFSIDLMRYDEAKSPKLVMDFLFVKLILWAQLEKFEWFHLGMAPLAGLGEGIHASLWNSFGAWVYEHGTRFYNFRGLRFYKDKFDPEWSPKYLAYPGGWSLARALIDISLLNSGGLKGLLIK